MEDFYAAGRTHSQPFNTASSVHLTSTPPPPPPKAIPPGPGQDMSRSETPDLSGPRPPPLPPGPHNADSPRPQPPLPASVSYLGSIQPHERQPPPPPVHPPAFEEQWLPSDPDLTTYSTADLAPLLQDTSVLTALAQKHPSYASSVRPLEAQIQQNLALADQLKQAETQLQALRHATSQLLLQHTSLQNTWRRKQSEMDNALSPWSPKAMYQRLVSSINEQEALLRAVVESFLEGGNELAEPAWGETNGNAHDARSSKATDKEVSDWIRRVREGTATLEKRREMRARWDEGRVGGWR